MSDAFLELRELTKRFGDHAAVSDLSLSVPQGKVLALLGPSGSGKTTTLRLLAGFDRPDRGTITLHGRDMTALPASERRFGMVFQHYALFPHLTVAENIAFGLAGRSSGAARARRVDEMLALVDLQGFGELAVGALSGGQQQRVAVARALAPEPEVLLLDEPLSNLDPTLRERTRRELRRALQKIGITTVLVTHEQDEAFALGDVVAVMRDGRLEQLGSPQELYEHPRTLFVATFVGRASVVPGAIEGAAWARVGEGVRWPVESPQPLADGTAVHVVVRPEGLRFGDEGVGGTVVERRYVGARAFYTVDIGLVTVEVEASVRAAAPGDAVRLVAQRGFAFPQEES